MYKNGKWAKQIIDLQLPDGSWGWFHSLGQLSGATITTEQALGRLEILGFTKEDEPIKAALAYMHRCLIGEEHIPDRTEKVQDWPVFCRMILAVRIRRFTLDDDAANQIADKWAYIIGSAFESGIYCKQAYEKAYCESFDTSGKNGRIIHYANFYPVSLLAGMLDEKTERAFLQDLIRQSNGIYYVYENKIETTPEVFQSKQANRYLSALELLGRYACAKEFLGFAAEWLLKNQLPNGNWDMGKTVNDKTVFPLSDDWRKEETRQADCTKRIKYILKSIQ